MSTFSRLLRRVRDGQNRANAHQPPNRNTINEFLALSRSSGATEISDRLRVFQECNQAISQLEAGSSTAQEINAASVSFMGGLLSDVTPAELAPKSEERNPYVRMVDKANLVNSIASEEVLERIFEGTDFVNHPAGLSSLTFAFGVLISLCISYIDRSDTNFNRATGFLDLSPLYGLTGEDSQSIRTGEGYGLFLPDAFFEDGERLLFLPPATSVLLILFNRNHNYIARRLFQENEKEEWVDPSSLEGDGDALAKQDEKIFQLARRINCGLFRNIVVNDFLKGLVGLGSNENNIAIDLFSHIRPEELGSHRTSVEFNFLYSWYSMMSEADSTYIEGIIVENFDTPAGDVELVEFDDFIDNFTDIANMNKGQRPWVGLSRDNKNGFFNDAELANILQTATETTASAFRARGTSPFISILELATMKQARSWEACSFNEFRKMLGLPAYTTFSDWCSTPEIAAAAEEIYGDIDRLELYVGLRGEDALGGAGFCLGKTTTQGLIIDIMKVVRSDPNFTRDFTRESLTNWGYEELIPDPDNGAFGACLPKLLLRNLPNDYDYNNVYALFPFTIPRKSRENLRNIDSSLIDYEFGRPISRHIETLDNFGVIKIVFDDPRKYRSPYGDDLKRITGGYGYMLGFDDESSHDRDQWMTLKALLPDAGSLGRLANFYGETTERLIRKKSKSVDDEKCRVDIIQEVINAVSTCWVAERLCNIPLNARHGFSDQELYQMLLDLHNCIFNTVEPQDRLALRKKAVQASKTITAYIVQSLHNIKADPTGTSDSTTSNLMSLFKEVIMNERPEISDAHDFLARLSASGRDIGALSANVLGLAVMSSISYAQTCGAAVRFYLDDARATERDLLFNLARQGSEVNDKIMGYIRESQRLDPQIPALYRDIPSDHALEIPGSDPVQLKKGDRVLADFKKAHAEVRDIDPDRQTRSLQGAGFHKCPGVPFVEQTMPEVFKAIFRLENIRRETTTRNPKSLLVSYKRPTRPSEEKRRKKYSLPKTPIEHFCNAILLIIVAMFLHWIITAVGSVYSNLRSIPCTSPRHLRPWEVYTLLPGPDSRTLPFTYITEHPQRRLLSFVDIDARDMQFKLYVDEKLKNISTDFELDKAVTCGQITESCIEKGFSRGSVIVPPGKHTVKLEWIGKDFLPGTDLVDCDSDRSRRFMWKQETC